jgi:hypothetical protein
MGMIIGFILGVLLFLTGVVFTFFCISEFSTFWSANLGWLAIIFMIVGIVTLYGGAYLTYNMTRR